MAALMTTAGYCLGLFAGAVELLAILGLCARVPLLSAPQAALAHAGAAVLCVIAARLRLHAAAQPDEPASESGRRRVECDVVALTALFVPLFGPALAWLFPRCTPAGAVDAHAWFEQHERMRCRERLHPIAPNDAADDPLPHDVMSFVEVLRRGSLDHKRNALRKLAQRGTPRHLGMLREALHSDDVELRLCAYGEIQALSRRHENRIAELQRQLDRLVPGTRDHASRHGLLTETAEAHQGYAASGLLDADMRRYHLRCGARCAEEAWQADPRPWRTATVYARTLSDLDDHERAQDAFAHLGEADRQRPEVCVAQAEIAFRRRDFAAVHAAGECLLQQQLALPDWLRALHQRTAGSGARA